MCNVGKEPGVLYRDICRCLRPFRLPIPCTSYTNTGKETNRRRYESWRNEKESGKKKHAILLSRTSAVQCMQ